MKSKKYWRRRRQIIRYKLISNYYKIKLDTVCRLELNNSSFKFLEYNINTKAIATFIQACSDWPKIIGLFHSMKLLGIAFSATPGLLTSGFTANGSYLIGILTSGDTYDFNNLAESKSSLVLSTYETKRKYIKFNGGISGYCSTDLPQTFDGKFYCETNSLAQNGTFIWTLQISFYCIFKNSN